MALRLTNPRTWPAAVDQQVDALSVDARPASIEHHDLQIDEPRQVARALVADPVERVGASRGERLLSAVGGEGQVRPHSWPMRGHAMGGNSSSEECVPRVRLVGRARRQSMGME